MLNRILKGPAGRPQQLAIVILASFAAFTTYFCMYGFRKAISAGTFEGMTAFGISFKSAIVIAQVLGYMTSKFIGIRFISEINPAKRGRPETLHETLSGLLFM